MLCLITNSLFAQVIFDPDSVNPDSLPSTMSVVEVNGQNFLQVALTQWDNYLQVSSTLVDDGVDAVCCPVYLYSEKNIVDTVDTYLIINVVSKPGTEASTIATICASKIPAGFSQYAEIVFPEKEITHLQFASRNPQNWEVKTTDTILVGKVEAYQMDESVIFDPATFDPDDLMHGMEIVTIDTTKYLKLTPHQYDIELPIRPFTSKYNKYAYGELMYFYEDTLLYESIAGSVEFSHNRYNVINRIHGPVADSFRIYFSNTFENQVINNLRFYVQDFDTYNALDYGEFYIGKLKAFKFTNSGSHDDPLVPCFMELDYSNNLVEIDGNKDAVYTQNDNIKNLINGELDELPAGPFVTVQPNYKSFGKLSASWDTTNVYLFIETAGSSQQYIELFLQSRGYVYSLPQLSDVVSFIVKPGQNSPVYGGNGIPEYFGNNDSTNIPFAITETDTGFVYELAIPWQTILKLDTVFYIEYLNNFAGTDIYSKGLGIDIMIHDIINEQETILSWANKKGFYGFEKDKADYIGQFTFSGEPTVGIEDKTAKTVLNLFPNPVNNKLTITSEKSIIRIRIFNVSGQEVIHYSQFNETEVNLNLEFLNQGGYMLQIDLFDGNSKTLKMIKL